MTVIISYPLNPSRKEIMEVQIKCGKQYCKEEVTEHTYCNRHFERELDDKYEEGYEAGKKAGMSEAQQPQ